MSGPRKPPVRAPLGQRYLHHPERQEAIGSPVEDLKSALTVCHDHGIGKAVQDGLQAFERDGRSSGVGGRLIGRHGFRCAAGGGAPSDGVTPLGSRIPAICHGPSFQLITTSIGVKGVEL